MEENPKQVKVNDVCKIEYITTLGELINSLVMKEFRKQDSKVQIEFAKKVWEDDDFPDLSMACEYIENVISGYGDVFSNVLIDYDDAGLFVEKLGEILNEYEKNPQNS